MTIARVTWEDLRAFVEELGGEWRETATSRQGNIEQNGSNIFLTLENEALGWFDDEDFEPAWSCQTMGGRPQSNIVIGVFYKPDRDKDDANVMLAVNVAKKIIGKWTGAIDWDDVTPP